jgi:hypothetical protein
MDPASFTLALPDDPELIGRLTDKIAAQGDPPITIARCPTAVVWFQCTTWDGMLRSRVIQALEAVVGPDWQSLVRPVE